MKKSLLLIAAAILIADVAQTQAQCIMLPVGCPPPVYFAPLPVVVPAPVVYLPPPPAVCLVPAPVPFALQPVGMVPMPVVVPPPFLVRDRGYWHHPHNGGYRR